MPRITDILQNVKNVAMCKLTATGAEMHLCPGFQPDFVLIYNKTNPSLHFWMKTMAAASYAKLVNHDTTQLADVSSAGIDEYAGAKGGADGTNDFYIKGSTLVATAYTSGDDLPEGITIVTDAVLNTASDELHVVMIQM